MSVQNVWNHLPIDTVSYTRRHDSSETMLWESEILHIWFCSVYLLNFMYHNWPSWLKLYNFWLVVGKDLVQISVRTPVTLSQAPYGFLQFLPA
jgi:hypothetical protein